MHCIQAKVLVTAVEHNGTALLEMIGIGFQYCSLPYQVDHIYVYAFIPRFFAGSVISGLHRHARGPGFNPRPRRNLICEKIFTFRAPRPLSCDEQGL